jgi:hypothetical protein
MLVTLLPNPIYTERVAMAKKAEKAEGERNNVPQPPFTKHVSMIAAEDDNGVIIQPAALEHVQQLADAVVDVADGAVIGAAGAADLLVAKVLIPQITNLEQPLRVRILFFFGDPDLGQLNLHPLVQVPVLLLDGVRVVRVREGDLVWWSSSSSASFPR